jgi:ADP-ribose pyrophosphatase
MPAKKSAASKSSAKQPLQVLSRKVVYKGRVFSVTSDHVREPNGVTAIRDVIRHSGSVVVLGIDDSEAEPRVLLERQYRYAAQDYIWELPAGRIDEGENALAAGKRELLEETGYTAKSWNKILFFYPSPGFLEETMTVFLARGLHAGTAQPEEDERIDHQLVPVSEVLRNITSGLIRDGKTIASVLWFKQFA